MKTQDQRSRDPSIERRVHIASQSAKDDWKNNIFNNFPANKDDDKSQSVLLQKNLQLLFGEIV